MAKKSDTELLSLIDEYSMEIVRQSRFLRAKIRNRETGTELEMRSMLICLRNIRASANQGVTALEQMLTR